MVHQYKASNSRDNIVVVVVFNVVAVIFVNQVKIVPVTAEILVTLSLRWCWWVVVCRVIFM